MSEHVILKRSLIDPSPTNPRKKFDEPKLLELAGTIKEFGVLEPLLVRAKPDGRYELIAGERRYRASELAGLKELPCIVKKLTDDQVLEIQYIENLQREDLTHVEEGEGFARLIASWGGKIEEGVQRLMDRLGKSRTHIYERLALAKLQGPARQALEEQQISTSIAKLAAKLPTEKLQQEFIKQVLHPRYGGEPLSFRQSEELLKSDYIRTLNGEFDWKSATLVRGVGSCKECPRRSGNIPGWEGSQNVCTDVACYGIKKHAAGELKIQAAEAKGVPVLRGKEWERVQYSGRYESPEYKCYDTGNPTPWRKLLQDELPIVLVQDSHDGVHERVDVQRARELLHEKGLIKERPRGGDSYAKQERLRQERERIKSDAETEAIVAAVERMKPGLEFWRMLAVAAAESGGFYRSETVARRRRLKTKGERPEESVKKFAAAASEEVCRGLAVELLAGFRRDHLAEMLKVDLKAAVERAQREAAEAKKKSKEKPQLVSVTVRNPIKGPQKPNAHGVYTKPEIRELKVQGFEKAKIEIGIVQAEDRKFYSAVSTLEVGDSGHGSPVTRKHSEAWDSAEIAMKAALIELIHLLNEKREWHLPTEVEKRKQITKLKQILDDYFNRTYGGASSPQDQPELERVAA